MRIGKTTRRAHAESMLCSEKIRLVSAACGHASFSFTCQSWRHFFVAAGDSHL